MVSERSKHEKGVNLRIYILILDVFYTISKFVYCSDYRLVVWNQTVPV